MSQMYTCAQIAERYGVKLFTVWTWIRKKKLNAIKIGKEYRIRQIDVEAFEQARMTTKL
jgi:DNA binding domain protein, excisionase family